MSANNLKPNQYFGLLKFFREKHHLEMFLDGQLYCNTPEHYRLSDAKGVSDKNESCMVSFRESRGDSRLKMSMDGKHIGEAVDLTIRYGRKDGWLHCWAILYLPEDGVGFEKLKSDIAQLHSEFGPYYAYINPDESHKLVKRIDSNVNIPVEANEVEYSEVASLCHSVFNKSDSFRYQREFRFVFGECDNGCAEPRIFYVEGGFRDIASASPKLEIFANTDSERLELV